MTYAMSENRFALAVLAVAAVVIATMSRADDVDLGLQVPADVVSVYDGDTMTVDAHPWPGLTIRTAVRLVGIDTPEINGKCSDERNLAQAAKAALTTLAGTSVLLVGVQPDKYGGRVDARVMGADGRDLAAAMIAAGHGRPYDGGRRAGWCD